MNKSKKKVPVILNLIPELKGYFRQLDDIYERLRERVDRIEDDIEFMHKEIGELYTEVKCVEDLPFK